MHMLQDFYVTLLYPFVLCNGGNHSAIQLSSSHLSDAEIIQLCQTGPKIDANTYFLHTIQRWNDGHVVRISKDTVVKSRGLMYPSELTAAELVRRETSIPVPYHQRFLPKNTVVGDRHQYLVMQYVEGDVLADVWDNLSWWMKLRIGITIRYYISQLRRLPSRFNLTIPGPLGDACCKSRLFTEGGVDRFSSYSGLRRWYADRLLWMQLVQHTPLAKAWGFPRLDIPGLDCSRPLAFVHQDLHLRNLLLGRDGQLWVLDWDMAGVYPDWFEYGNMVVYAEECKVPDSWRRMLPWMLGRFEGAGQMPFIRSIMYTLQRLPPDITHSIAQLVNQHKG